MRRSLMILIMLFTLPVATAAIAQQKSPADAAAQRAEAMKRIEMIRIYRLIEVLDLDQEKAVQLFPILQRYDKQFQEVSERKEQDYSDLEEEASQPKPDKTKLNKLIDSILALEQETMKIHSAEYNELKKYLTPDQCAKYMIAERKFLRDFNRMLDDIRRKRPADVKNSSK